MTEEQYLQGVLDEIERVKGKKGRGVFRVNAKIPDNTAKYVKAFFGGNSDYDVEIRKCKSCSGTWDIMIYFKK